MSQDKPHDGLFRFSLSDLATARSHFQAVLPPEVAARIDWTSLAPSPGTFVDEALRDLHTDQLFQVLTLTGQPLRLYLLFEHQSTPDGLMPYRLLRYMVRIWDEQLRADPPEKLTPIIPLVLYHGADAWTVPPDLAGMLRLEPDLDAALRRYIPTFAYELQDLSAIPDEALVGTALRRMTLLLLKHARDGDLWERLPGWLDLLAEIQAQGVDGLRAIQALIRYIVLVSPHAPGPEVRAALRHRLGSKTEEVEMTYAEQLREEGREELREELRKAREALRQSIEDVLAQRFPDADLNRLAPLLAEADQAALQAALRLAVSAPSLTAFEATLTSRASGQA